MTTTTSVITILSTVIGMVIGFTSCSLLKKTTKKPEGVVDQVPYGDKILLHMHPQKFLPFLPDLKEEQIAYLFGMDLKRYRTVVKEYDDEARNKAAELLRDPEFAKKVDQLPFKKNQSVLILGESTADALNSWVYILKHLLDQRRPEDKINVINGAVSGQTTTEALRKITAHLQIKPNWIVCHLGANDCMRYGGETQKTTVSPSETLMNLKALEQIISQNTDAALLWITPSPVNEEKIASFPPFKRINLSLKNKDLLTIADRIKEEFEPVLDLRDHFGVPAKSSYVQFDGGHLTIEGQSIIATGLVNKLAEGGSK